MAVTSFDRWVIGLTVLSVIGIPMLIVMIRGAMKWTHVEDKLGVLVDKISEIVTDKEKVHSDLLQQMGEDRKSSNDVHREILEQMRLDRDATDRRLRYIEEWYMELGKKTVSR